MALLAGSWLNEVATRRPSGFQSELYWSAGMLLPQGSALKTAGFVWQNNKPCDALYTFDSQKLAWRDQSIELESKSSLLLSNTWSIPHKITDNHTKKGSYNAQWVTRSRIYVFVRACKFYQSELDSHTFTGIGILLLKKILKNKSKLLENWFGILMQKKKKTSFK